MSHYTTEVRYICETYAGFAESKGVTSVKEAIDKSWQQVFDSDIPFFDEAYRPLLCKKILMHYYTREIGQETVGLWKLYLNNTMREIMPYFNELYKTTLYKFNPLYEVDYQKDHKGNETGVNSDKTIGETSGTTDETTSGKTKESTVSNEAGENSSHTTTSGKSWDIYSDTPQGSLVNVENETYLTNARKITNNQTQDSSAKDSTARVGQREADTSDTSTVKRRDNNTVDRNGSFANLNEYSEHVFGKTSSRSYASLIKEFRDNILNIDMMVIDQLKPLFFLLWG